MKYVLAIVAMSYALRCFAMFDADAETAERKLRRQADKVRDDAEQDLARRFVELLWAWLFGLIAYRLLVS